MDQPRRLGVPGVHAEQVAGEQRRLLAALARLDLEQDVLAVGGVARDQQVAQPLLGRVQGAGQLLGLEGERLVLAGELAGSLEVPAELDPFLVGAQDRAQLGVPLTEPARQRLVGVHRRVRQLGLELGVLGSELRDGFEHRGLLGR